MSPLQRTFAGVATWLLLVLLVPAGVAIAAVDREDYTQAVARDVFVVLGSTLRNPEADTSPSADLYNVSGISLGVNWGQFTGATATSRAHRVGGATDVRIDLAGLIPNGVYSIFYGTIGPDSENPLCPGVERTLPLSSFKLDAGAPDSASFVADGAGAAEFRARIDGAPLDADQFFYNVIYHADGLTYGDLPNRGEWLTQGPDCRSSFGHDAMRQLFVMQDSV